MKKKKKIFLLLGTVVILCFAWFFAPGCRKCCSVLVTDYEVSADGKEITINVETPITIGFIRDATVHKQKEGKLCLDFYYAFGGINGKIGATNTFTFQLDEDTSSIAFYIGSNTYQTELEKDENGNWHCPRLVG